MGRNSEWPKMAVLNFLNNFSQKDGKKFGIAKIRHSEFIQTLLVQKDLQNFGMAKIRHSKFIQTFWCLKNGRNLEWPKLVPKLWGFLIARMGHEPIY